MGEKDVAVPFDQLQLKDKNGKRYLVMNANKEALNSAPGLTFDRSKQQWIPENKNARVRRHRRANGAPET